MRGFDASASILADPQMQMCAVVIVPAQFQDVALASDRFPGQPLVVDGSDAFRATVLEMSGQSWFRVTFADPALERARRGIAQEEEAVHPVT